MPAIDKFAADQVKKSADAQNTGAATTTTPSEPNPPATTPAKPPVETKVEGAGAVVKEEPVAGAPDDSKTEEEVALDDLLGQVTGVTRSNLLNILDYIETMKPGRPLDTDTVHRHQAALYRSIASVINNSDEQFQIAFTCLLMIFAKFSREGHALHALYVLREITSLRMPVGDRKAFERLVNMLTVMGPVAGRDVAKRRLNFEETMRYGVTPSGKARVAAYFKI